MKNVNEFKDKNLVTSSKSLDLENNNNMSLQNDIVNRNKTENLSAKKDINLNAINSEKNYLDDICTINYDNMDGKEISLTDVNFAKLEKYINLF